MTSTHRRPWQAGREDRKSHNRGHTVSSPSPLPCVNLCPPLCAAHPSRGCGGCQLPVSPHLFLPQLSVGLQGSVVGEAAFRRSTWMSLSTPGEGRVLTLWLSTCPPAFILVQTQSLAYCLSGRATVREKEKAGRGRSETRPKENQEVTLRGREVRKPFLPSISDSVNPQTTLLSLIFSQQLCVVVIIPILQVANPRIREMKHPCSRSHG